MRGLHKIVIIFVALSFPFTPYSIAFMKETHENINKVASDYSSNEFSLDSYLKERLALHSGVEELVKAGKISKSITGECGTSIRNKKT